VAGNATFSSGCNRVGLLRILELVLFWCNPSVASVSAIVSKRDTLSNTSAGSDTAAKISCFKSTCYSWDRSSNVYHDTFTPGSSISSVTASRIELKAAGGTCSPFSDPPIGEHVRESPVQTRLLDVALLDPCLY